MKTTSMCLLFAALVIPAFAAEPLLYKTPKDVSFTVTADGLSSIKTASRELAKGSWTAFNADVWFKSGSGKISFKNLKNKTLEVLGADHARVRHEHDDVTVTYDYSFAGEDVTISARVENNHPDEALGATGFGGLQFTFDSLPEGLMNVQHISYFQANGVSLCHPGHWSKVGGSYATDKTIGVGTSPWRTGIMRTLFLWDYSDWNAGKRETVPSRNLMYFAASSIAPRGAQTFDWKLRVSPDRDWKHLLAPYKEHFQKTFGPVQYKVDNRWISTDYLNHSQQAVSKENPYGFHGGYRRIDTAEGAKKFCEVQIPPLKNGNGQGVIVWGQGGDDPRGGMYRPDFDILPPEVEAQFGGIVKNFKDAGLKFGVCTRPHDMAVKWDWKTDTIIQINPDDKWQMEVLWHRFDTMIKRGCTLFYLDSFGTWYDDIKVMRYLREKMGPDILTFCEHQCDAIFPYSGGYSETTLQADSDKPHYRLWSDTRLWEIYEWLTPGAQMSSRLYETKGKAPEKFETSDHFFYSHRITPLMPNMSAGDGAAIKATQSEFLDDKAQWKAAGK